MLKPGNQAPELVLEDQEGRMFRLSSLRGKSCAVVYFYPKDETPVCTAEACGFRDHFTEFQALGAVVIGISRDGMTSHRLFAERHQLPFLLLSDPKDQAFTAFGLKQFLGLRQRATFVVDERGIIRASISSWLNAAKHVRNALEALSAQGLARL
jgi:peroxiredoxin Q/BCP